MNLSFKLQSLQDFKDVFVCLQMRESLMKLQKGIGLKDYNSDSEESRYHWRTESRLSECDEHLHM